MWETDSEQVPWGKDEKNFEKRVKKYLKLYRSKGWKVVLAEVILTVYTWMGPVTSAYVRMGSALWKELLRSWFISMKHYSAAVLHSSGSRLTALLFGQLVLVSRKVLEHKVLLDCPTPITGLRYTCSRSLTKCFSFTRLETRTKESNIYASIRVENSNCVMKVIAETARASAGGSKRPWAYLLGPERWWTMPEQSEARGNSGGSSKRYWRANRSSDLGIGAKD